MLPLIIDRWRQASHGDFVPKFLNLYSFRYGSNLLPLCTNNSKCWSTVKKIESFSEFQWNYFTICFILRGTVYLPLFWMLGHSLLFWLTFFVHFLDEFEFQPLIKPLACGESSSTLRTIQSFQKKLSYQCLFFKKKSFRKKWKCQPIKNISWKKPH